MCKLRFLLVLMLAVPVANAQVTAPTNVGYVADFDLKKPAKVVWKFESAKKKNFEGKMLPIGLSDVCLTDGVVYIGDDTGILRAFRSEDGEKLWEHKHGDRIYFAPVCDGTRVYVSSSSGLEAIACKTGESIWRKDIEAPGHIAVWPPRDPGKGKVQTLYVGTGDGMMNAFLAPTGTRRWRESMMENVPDDPDGFDGNAGRGFNESKARPTGIATDGKLVFQGIFDQSRVVAMRGTSGGTIWSFETKGWLGAAPTVDGDDVFVGSQDKHVYRVDRETGKKAWQFKTGSRVSSAPVVHGNKVLATSCDGYMYCINRETGEEMWKYRTDPDKTGRRFIYSEPVVTKDSVYFVAGVGLVYALDTENGTLRWKLRPLPDSQLYSAVVTDGTRIFMTSRPDWDGKGAAALIAIGPKKP